ncbi:DNA recombination protein RmuC [Fangia hongkongensis]|uniref:DNA recombination protein RmuC n=1 Tax=Fangia hongkongensis TaxID=270495 RepID=UPI00036B1E35|nr:DNA recombination protein RmuC [Fangia hongkongensis]MBK2124027.1 DNA recombination protein RmuC [Fangia hongkongensis]
MQIIELIIVAVICFVAGALLILFIKGKKLAELNLASENSRNDYERVQQENANLVAKMEDEKTRFHQQEIVLNKQQEKVSYMEKSSKRLEDELNLLNEAHASQKVQLENMSKAYHDANGAHQIALEKLQNLQEQSSDLEKRLANSNDLLEKERETINSLKEALAEEGKKYKAQEAAFKEVSARVQELKIELEKSTHINSDLNARCRALDNERAELKTTIKDKDLHFKEQTQQFNETKAALTKEFENLANKIFEEKGKTFTQSTQVSIDNMLKPFREQIEGFQKRVNDVHSDAIKENASLNAEIQKVLDIGLKMSKEANNLTSALKGDSQKRGVWGEAQLRRTLEMSGLIEDAHYEVQSAFKDLDGKQKQTDYLIKLPDGKHMIIDSKVSLNAYDRMVGAESESSYKIAMNEHILAVKKHIDDLASKDYTNVIGMKSPSFVLMFMPIEPAYIEALKHSKNVFEYGYKKGVVLVSHTTLIPILRTVSNLWMIERSNTEAREISEKAGDIYNQVCVVADYLNKLGGTLGTVSNHYNNAVTALAGKRGLYGKVDRFSQLSAKVTKKLPQLEPSHIDFEADRLSLIIEPINEAAENVELTKVDDK